MQPQFEHSLHPLAREHLKRLPHQELWQRYQDGVTERLNTNIERSQFSIYPRMNKHVLKERYAKVLLEQENLTVDSSYIHFTAGLSEAIDLIIRCFAEPGRSAITITSPTFPLYQRLAAVYGIAIQDVKLLGEHLNCLDLNGLMKTDNQIIFICNPNNPIGTVLSEAQVTYVCERAAGLVVVDEAYIEHSEQRFSAAHLLARCPNLLVLRTFSKAWGLAGLRISAVLAHPSILATLTKVQCPFSVNMSAMMALEERLAKPAYLARSVKAMAAARYHLSERLRECDSVKKIFPSSTNFILAELTDFTERMAMLSSYRCLAIGVGDQVPSCARLSIGTPAENDHLIFILNQII